MSLSQKILERPSSIPESVKKVLEETSSIPGPAIVNGSNGLHPAENGSVNGENGSFNGGVPLPIRSIPNGTSNGTAKDSINGSESDSKQFQEPTDTSGTASNHRVMPIAIVGMACRLPGGVTNTDEFWELCSRERTGWSEIPKERFNLNAYHHPNPDKLGCFNPIGGSFLKEDITLFDAHFFNLSAQEAATLDPQGRILMECAYEALEDAGITKEDIAGQNIGCFVGGSFSDYELQNLRDTDTAPPHIATGTHACMLSNRLSYHFDLKGPSFIVDTACSSSLTALHVACQSLRSGECEAALVGGSHLNLQPDHFVIMSLQRLFSDTGVTHSFDDRSTSGFGRGEGAGCIILKPLDKAIADGDIVHAVIASSGVNQDGRTVGITQPNGKAQEDLIRSVYEKAGLDVMDCGFIEAHGTGTKVGDPIEATALYNAFRKEKKEKKPLYIGSVKSNIGHLEGASGVVSIIKAALILEKGFILPNINFDNANPSIPLKKWNMSVPTSQKPWPSNKRFVSVNNFGFGGSNAHFVLEKAPKPVKGPALKPMPKLEYKIFVLSAAAEAAVKVQMKSLEVFLEQRPEAFEVSLFPNLAYTLCQRRSLLTWRVAVAATCTRELMDKLSAKDLKPIRSTEKPTLGFVFTGQGAQWFAMGRELMSSHPVFAKSIQEADDCLKGLGAAFSLIDELSKDKTETQVDNASISQPACTAIQIALTDLLRTWEIYPDAVTGHSSGEIGAAYAAGILNLEEAMAIAYYRGVAAIQLRENFPEIKGAMLAVGASDGEIQPLLKCLHNGQVKIACINSPSSITASGDADAIKELADIIEKKGLFNRQLKVDLAYHSHHMLHVAEEYRAAIQHINPRPAARVAFFSSLVGREVEWSEVTSSYWVNNLTSQVKFAQSLQELCSSTRLGEAGNKKVNILCEIGPHSALEGPVKQILKSMSKEASKIKYVPCLVRNRHATETALELASMLFMHGCRINFGAINFVKSDEKKPALLPSLPHYPWQRTKLWKEGRISQNHRLKRFPRSDLIGTLADDSNDMEPRWRNVIRADDLPWARHHSMQNLAIWPMTGYIAMAMEASKQRAIMRDVKFDKFAFREVTISRPLTIQDDTEVEAMITLRPYAEGTRTTSDTWDEFRIFSWAEGKGWMEHCNGLVSPQETPKSNPINGERQLKNTKSAFQDRISTINSACNTAVDSSTMYKTLSESGVQYGESFQGLENIQACNHHAVADIRFPNIAATMPHEHESDYMAHPAPLDMCIQIVWPIFGAGRMGISQLYLPSFIKNLSISCNISSKKAGDIIRIHGSGDPHAASSKPVHLDLFATNPDSPDEVLFDLEGLIMTPVYDKDVDSRKKAARELCYKLQWDMSVESMKPNQFKKMLDLDPLELDEKRKIHEAEQASFYYLQNALAQVLPASLPNHYKNFYAWMQNQVEIGREGSLPLQTAEWLSTGNIDRKKMLEAFKKSGTIGEMICSVGEKLPEILKGEIEPLSIMQQDDLLNRYNETMNSSSRGCAQATIYLEKLAYQNPHLTILEIGAGRGGASLQILEALGGSADMPPQLGRYVYTDTSDEFFDDAKKKFSKWESLVEFRKLDPEKSLAEQGINKESFDVVIAANTLHWKKSLNRAMRNTRKLLKPNGKLLLIEETSHHLSHFIQAILPSWWQSDEQHRSHGLIIDEAIWDNVLLDAGFSGIDLLLEDFPKSDEQQRTLMISTAPSKAVLDAEVAIVTHDTSPSFPISTLAESIQKLTGKSPVINSLSEVGQMDGKICIFLGELTKPLLKNIDAPLFDRIKQIITSASSILWVSRGGYLNSECPDANMVNGLARTIRSETTLKFVTLDLDSSKEPANIPSNIDEIFNNPSDLEQYRLSRFSEDFSIDKMLTEAEAAEMIFRVFKTSFSSDASRTELDMEYVERSGNLLIPRIIEDNTMNNFVHQETQESEPFLQKFKQPGRPLRMTIENYGSLDTLYFADDTTATEPLPDDHVEIEVKVTGLNFKDIMIAMGQLPTETVLGVECSGVVTRVGSKVSRDFLAVGDRVAAMSSGTFGNFTRCVATNACRIPDNMPFDVAATIPIIFGTAYYAINDLARLSKGESILIHAAAGGVGQAAIILSQIIGATIYTTVGSLEKKEFLMKQYDLPEENIFYSRDTSFGMDVKRATNGKGVDVVLNSLAGDFLETTWKCLAHFGRFIEIGKRDIVGNTRLEMQPFEYNATFASVDLTKVGAERPLLMKRLMSDVFSLFADGHLTPVAPITVFPISDVERAFRLLQGGKTMGKVVVQASPDDQVKAVVPKISSSLLHADATYIIVGGTGGIGRSITKWMVEKGARNIILISRSGNSKQNVKDLIQELSEMGAKVVAHKCDVGCKDDVDSMLKYAAKNMPPVRGVVHGAMVLNDVLFEKMTFTNWDEVVKPKVAGAWNLHNGLIREPLDFFISLSSVAGVVGNRGQAAYAAAGTFLDAFAQHRISQGLPCTSLDLTAVEDIGYLAENLDKQALVTSNLGGQVIFESEIIALMAAAISGKMTTCNSHCITGLKLDSKAPDNFWANDAKFSHLRRRLAMEQEDTGGNAPTVSIGTAVKRAASHEEAVQIVYNGLAAKVSSVLLIPLDIIDPTHSISSYKLDSLVAIEIRNWITRELEANLQVLELLTSSSMLSLSEMILKKSKLVAKKAEQTEEGQDE